MPSDETPELITVPIGLGGEILSVTESPLNRAVTADLYGIQVNKFDVAANAYKPYAYGLFDNVSNITISLEKGEKYRFVATMMVDGKNICARANGGYYTPFTLLPYATPEISNAFIYSAESKLHSLGDSGIYSASEQKIYSFPQVDRYYGDLFGFIAAEGAPVNVDMKRMVFGLNLSVENLTEGKVTITMTGARPIVIAYPSTTFAGIFSQKDIPVSLYSPDHKDKVKATITWTKADESVETIGEYDFAFARLKNYSVNIKLPVPVVKDYVGNIRLNMETAAMTAGDSYTIEQDGTMSKDTAPVL